MDGIAASKKGVVDDPNPGKQTYFFTEIHLQVSLIISSDSSGDRNK